CESPLTFQAIIIWRDELNDGKILLRDIIDLEATYSGPDAHEPVAAEGEGESEAAAETPDGESERELGAEGEAVDDEESNLSLSAMEAELKPRVLETFDRIADSYKKLRRLQDQHVENRLKN